MKNPAFKEMYTPFGMKKNLWNIEWKFIPDSYILANLEDGTSLNDAFKCFQAEYVFRDNIRRFGNRAHIFAEWLQGLPTAFCVDFVNYDILQRGIEWNRIPINATEEQEDDFLENWFLSCSLKFLSMRFNTQKPENIIISERC